MSPPIVPGKTRTGLAEVLVKADYRTAPPQAGAQGAQIAKAGTKILSNEAVFLNQVAVRNPAAFKVLDTKVRLANLPRDKWADADLRGKRVLVLLPSRALGDNVPCALFLEALRTQRGVKALGVFCAGAAAPIYRLIEGLEVFPVWLERRALKRWDVLIDLGHVEARRDIELWPVDMEDELLKAFGLDPASARFPADGRVVPSDRPLSIGVWPLASSPLRTLPPPVTVAVCNALAARGLPTGSTVTLYLNKFQGMGRLLAEAVRPQLADGVRVIDGFESIDSLLQTIRTLDYGVFADSGPAHIAKLYATPGLAVYTSAHAEILQGRFRNITPWHVGYAGPHCAAPCGLSKVRQTADGRVGCMGSLGVPSDALPEAPKEARPDDVRRLVLEAPVPCVAALASQGETVVAAVHADLARRGAILPQPA